MAGVTLAHADIALNIATALKPQLPSGCKVRNSDARVGISEKGPFTYPDVSVSCAEGDRTAQQFIQSPCLLIEVLSASTEAYDRGRKFELYRQIESLREYILVGSETKTVEVFRRGSDGGWTFTAYGVGDIIPIESLDLTVALDVIYEDVAIAEQPKLKTF